MPTFEELELTVINSLDKVPDWDTIQDVVAENVTKIVIGQLDKDKPLECEALPQDFATRFPALKQLYLWNVKGLVELPELPPGLKCLDCQGCSDLQRISDLPTSLEYLILDGCSSLSKVSENKLSDLLELSIRQCVRVPQNWILEQLKNNQKLSRFWADGCTQISAIKIWPEQLVDLRLNECSRLEYLAPFPPHLRRLELRRAAKLIFVPSLPATADYVDLAYTKSLKQLPDFPPRATNDADATRRPRTLFLFESGVPLDRDLYGETDEVNVADRVLADRENKEVERIPDQELKVILLGNGRCGKSSLARRWIRNDFREDEQSTHGIRLWEKQLEFVTHEGDYSEASLNIWDFAGQDLYHSTHRLFLQSRAIYIICHTEHPPGADPESDLREQAQLRREGEDVNRSIKYWLDQVASLGKIPGTDMFPPVLIVRTKIDRDLSQVKTYNISSDEIRFSAKTGDGLEQIVDWIKQQVSQLLGPWDARTLPADAMAVKQELAAQIQANRSEYWKSEEENKHLVKSPFPKISLADFHQLVEKHCTGYYREKPSILLDRFHRSGFLYHDSRYLPDDVILDQRWALQAIYAFSSRHSEFTIRDQLIRDGGLFTLDEIAELSWNPAGYDAKAQQLFLSFMESCGMCFELMRATESRSGFATYVAPGFLPTKQTIARYYPTLFSQDRSEWANFEIKNVSEADVRSLISSFGADWSRAMRAWKWGLQIQASDSESTCSIEWNFVENGDDYEYPLSVRFSGPIDRPFESLVRDRLERTLGNHQFRSSHELDRIWPKIPAHELEILNLPRFDRDEVLLEAAPQRHPERTRKIIGDRKQQLGVCVTLSFAGSDEKSGEIGRIPHLVAERVRALKTDNCRCDVLIYTSDEGSERLSAFLKQLAQGDIVVVFWSKKYWYSPYCMAEMMLIYKDPPIGQLLTKRVLVYQYGQQRLTNEVARIDQAGDQISAKQFDDHWKQITQQRMEFALQQSGGDHREAYKILEREGAVHDWYEFTKPHGTFEQFVRTMCEYRNAQSISIPVSNEIAVSQAESIVDRVKELMLDAQALIDLAVHRFEQQRLDDAIVLLFAALSLQPDSDRNFRGALERIPSLPKELKTYALGAIAQSDVDNDD